jgi:hypothetical protein
VPRPALTRGAIRNEGAREAGGEVLVFLDPDCLPRADWLARMLAPFRESDVVGVKGAYMTHQHGLLPRLIQAEYEEGYRRLEGQKSIDVVEGYSAAYRRDVFLAVGGFDPVLAAADDSDLSYRLAQRGRLVFARDAIVYHNHASSLRRYFERHLRLGLWQTLVAASRPRGARPPAGAPESPAEVSLAGLSAASFLLGLRWRGGLPLAGLLMAAFVTLAVPRAWRNRQAGADVALAMPGFTFARGLARALGATIGGAAIATQKLLRATRGWRRWQR